MTENSHRDDATFRDFPDGRDAPRGRRGRKTARNLIGTRAVSHVRMRPKVLSWRVARNPLFHASVVDAA